MAFAIDAHPMDFHEYIAARFLYHRYRSVQYSISSQWEIVILITWRPGQPNGLQAIRTVMTQQWGQHIQSCFLYAKRFVKRIRPEFCTLNYGRMFLSVKLFLSSE